MADPAEVAAQAAIEIVKANAKDIYGDALQPATIQAGKSLELVGRAINLALAPARGLIWGGEQVVAYLEHTLPLKLAFVSPEKIVPPDASILGPAMEGIRFRGAHDEIREMFATLIASSMQDGPNQRAHPSYVEVIKQLSPDEGLILKYFPAKKLGYFAGIDGYFEPQTGGRFLMQPNFSSIAVQANCKVLSNGRLYLENLLRLRLLSKEPESPATRQEAAALEDALRSKIRDGGVPGNWVYERATFMVTGFGTKFIGTCVDPLWDGLPDL